MTESRLLFVALPPPEVRDALLRAVRINRLDTRLGSAMFPHANWHQTLSDRYPDTAKMRARMLRAGARAAAHACTLTFNRLRDQRHGETWDWAFKAKGRPQGFDALLAAIAAALATEGVETATGHTPHMTVSYWAPEPLGPSDMAPLHWTLTDIRLVLGGGQPYQYTALGQWPLQPPPADPKTMQLSLF